MSMYRKHQKSIHGSETSESISFHDYLSINSEILDALSTMGGKESALAHEICASDLLSGLESKKQDIGLLILIFFDKEYFLSADDASLLMAREDIRLLVTISRSMQLEYLELVCRELFESYTERLGITSVPIMMFIIILLPRQIGGNTNSHVHTRDDLRDFKRPQTSVYMAGEWPFDGPIYKCRQQKRIIYFEKGADIIGHVRR